MNEGLAQNREGEVLQGVPITFGSWISFSLMENKHCYLSSEGFMLSQLFISNFEDTTSSKLQDFSFCTFRILPFSSTSNFRSCISITKEIVDRNADYDDQDLKMRKNQIHDLKQNLDGELNSNINIYNKLRGTPVFFQTSIFQLVHTASMKFLNMNCDDENNIFLELIDFPSETSFFKFTPCLKLQSNRNNVVYHNDLVVICSSKLIFNRNPFIITDYIPNVNQGGNNEVNGAKLLNENNSNKVYGDIEKSRKFRVHIYNSFEIDDEMANYLIVGDIIWLHLSEKNHTLSAEKKNDPFQKMFANISQPNMESSEATSRHRAARNTLGGHTPNMGIPPNIISYNHPPHANPTVFKPNQPSETSFSQHLTKEHFHPPQSSATVYKQTHIAENQHNTAKELFQKSKSTTSNFLQVDTDIDANSGNKIRSTSRLTSSPRPLVNFDEDFNLTESLGDVQLEFTEIHNKKMSELSSARFFWKIEGIEPYVGGLLKWETPYKIKHFSTGKYLRVLTFGMGAYSLELSTEADPGCYFIFVPLENQLISSEKARMFISKESFFRIQHKLTQTWIGFEEVGIENEKVHRISKHHHISKSPILMKTPKPTYTFKMLKADFEEVWESKFLLFTIPIFREGLEIVKKLRNKSALRDSTNSRIFIDSFNRMFQAIELLEHFINNKLASNIMINQEYGHPSSLRQRILREQFILGMMVYLLYKVFPTPEEFKSFDLDTVSLQLFRGIVKVQSTAEMVRDTVYGNNKLKRIERIEQDYANKRLTLSFRLFSFLKDCCLHNAENQEYIYNFLHTFERYAGYGPFVSKALASFFKDNEKLLFSLSKYSLQPAPQIHSRTAINLDTRSEHDQPENEKFFLTELAMKLKAFPNYSKSDIIDVFGDFCLSEKNAVYVNQEKIFRVLIEDNNLFKQALLKIVNKSGNELLIEIKDKEGGTPLFKLEEFVNKHQDGQELSFLKSQLNLYANLCMNRNYNCCKFFADIFPLTILVRYILENSFDEDIKASFCKLVLNIYINKEPRTILTKPNLVRVINLKEELREPKSIKHSILNLKEIGANLRNFKWRSSSSSASKAEKASLIEDEPKDISLKRVKSDYYKLGNSPLIIREQKQEDNDEDMGIEREELIILEGLKKELLSYLQTKYTLLMAKGKGISVFTVLTLEVIKILHMMLKFGLFKITSPIIKKIDDSKLTKKMLTKLMVTTGLTNQTKEESEIEKLVNYLAAFLEFDENYFTALRKMDIKRKYEEHKESNKNELLSIEKMKSGIKEMGNTLLSFKSFFKLNQKNNNNKVKVNVNFEMESELIKDSLFKKIQSLKKILMKFSNKTYTVKNEETEGNFEVAIKIEICEVFSYLMDIREEYYIDNVISYFKEVFVEKLKQGTKVELIEDSLIELGPESFIEGGKPIKKEGIFGKNYTNSEPIKSFDHILGRPFIECLLIGFYFTNKAELQNPVFNLIKRWSSQKKTFLNHIDRLELLFSSEHISLYHRVNALVAKLTNLLANSQVWLQISNTVSDARNERYMDKTLEKLWKLESIFKKITNDKELLRIKQSIFKNTGGIILIYQILETGHMVMDSNIDIIHTYKTKSTNSDMMVTSEIIEKLIKIISFCYTILTMFCQENAKNQESIYKKLNKTFILQKDIGLQKEINYGQIELVNQIFMGNPQLCNVVTDSELEYFSEMIMIHGHYAEFLDIFEILNNEASYGTSVPNAEIAKKVIRVLLNENYIEFITPFKDMNDSYSSMYPNSTFFLENKRDIDVYKNKFIQIVARALSADIGVNLVSKAFHHLPIKELLSLLYLRTRATKDDSFERIEIGNLGLRKAVCDLLILFFSKSDQALNEFSDQSKTFSDMIEIETAKIERNEMFSEDLKNYILSKIIPLVNIYAESFLKDIGLLMIYSSSETTNKLGVHKKLLDFAEKLINNLGKFIDIKEIKGMDPLMKNIVKLATNFRLDISSISENDRIKKNLQMNMPTEQTYNGDSSISLDANIGREFINPLTKKGSRPFEMDSIRSPTKVEREFSPGGKRNIFRSLKKFTSRIEKTLLKRNAASSTQQLLNKIASREGKDDEGGNAGVFSEYWEIFKEIINKSKKIQKLVKEEKKGLSISIMGMYNIFVEPMAVDQKELLINHEDMLIKFINYLEFWKQKKADKGNIIFLLQVFGDIIENDPKIEEIQNLMDKFSATRISLALIWEENEPDTSYLYYLLKFTILLLCDGNITVQKTVYDFFITNSLCEKFFRKINNILIEKSLSSQQRNSFGKKERKIIHKILRLLQLLCEGHNKDLQNYIRYQFHSKNNFDMINLTIKLLMSFKINDSNYESVSQCFDTLTEFIQGPCKENQKAMVDSKFMEYAVSVLGEDEKIFEPFELNEPVDAKYRDDDKTPFLKKPSQSSLNVLSPLGKGTTLRSYDGGDPASYSKEIYRRKFNIHPGRLARLQYKCLITVYSLLECNEASDNIISRIRRAIPMSLLKNNLMKNYQLYKKLFNEEYSERCFNLIQTKIEEGAEETERDEFILESGFLCYILMNSLLDDTKNFIGDEEDEEVNELIREFSQYDSGEKGFLKNNILGEFSKLGTSMFKTSMGFIKDVKSNLIDKALSIGTNEQNSIEAIKQNIEKKEVMRQAVAFFRKNISHIEIIRDNKIYKIYFPMLPYCRMLPKSVRKSFHANVNRASTKTKLTELMKFSDKIIKIMKHEERLRIFLNKNQIIGILANHGLLWEYCAFYTNIIINTFVLISYSSYFVKVPGMAESRLSGPRLGFDESNDWTMSLITTLGLVNLVFSSLVVFFFFIKRAPLLLIPVWENYFEDSKKLQIVWKVFDILERCWKSFYVCINDIDFIFYCLYIFFCIAGLSIHPFMFVLLLSDFLRIEVLKNVVRAVWIPKLQLGLTFLVFIVFQYFFTIIGYFWLSDQYNGYCTTFWMCFITTWDQTFKNSGAIGGFLSDEDQSHLFIPDGGGDPIDLGISHTYKDLYLERFFFDNIFFLLLVLIIINMVAGIIIDTFGLLKDALQEKEKDETQYCFICGISREKLDKSSDSKHGFFSHIKQDHYMWNFINYKAYLKFKEQTEFNGNESYVFQKIENFDLGWFPMKRALAVKDEEDDDRERLQMIDGISQNMVEINQSLINLHQKINMIIENNTK